MALKAFEKLAANFSIFQVLKKKVTMVEKSKTSESVPTDSSGTSGTKSSTSSSSKG
jgi:hypothetical protein